jgi:hypothetical protein
MEAKQFLEKITGVGYHCLFAIRAKNQSTIVQEFYKDFDDLLARADNLNEHGYETYFSLGTFEANKSREATNVAQMKSFFLDIDVGEDKEALGKGYASKSDALIALQKFCSDVGLAKPAIVDSGNGLHIYWALDVALSLEEWLPVAEGLKQTCRGRGLAIDPAVPADAARVLRIPNTGNYKDQENPVPVSILLPVSGITTIDYFTDKVGRVEPRSSPYEPDVVSKAHFANQDNSFKKILKRTHSGKGCEQLQVIIAEQATIEEPLWRAGLSIAKYCSDGSKAAIVMSAGYPDYDPSEMQDKHSKIKGPYTCNTFDNLNPNVCVNCPNWGKIKSPILLGKVVVEATTEPKGSPFGVTEGYTEGGAGTMAFTQASTLTNYLIPKYPAPYIRGKHGGVYLRSRDEDGEEINVPIYHNDFYAVKRIHDAEFGESIVVRLHLPKDGVREFTMPLAVMTAREELRKKLAAQGMTIEKPERAMTYLIAWVNQLQEENMAEPAHKQFGWVDEKMDTFVLGDRILSPHGDKINAANPQTEQYFDYLDPKGSLEVWKENVNFWNRPGMELYQFVLCTGFGSILMPFSNVSATTLHLHNKNSGVAKSLAMYSSIGIYGNPKLLTQTYKDSVSSKMNRGEIWKNLPFTVDEITNMEPKEASELLYTLTDGTQRNRMSGSNNLERYRGKPWNLIAVTTSNTSILEKIRSIKNTPEAEAQRVMECYVPDVSHLFEGTAITNDFESRIMDNFGTAGPVYVRYIMDNVEMARKLCLDLQERIDREGNLVQKNRFWSALMSRTLAGAILAKRAGLIDFNIEALYRWTIDVLLAQNKTSVMGMHADYNSIMNDFFLENYRSILRIKSTTDSRGGEAVVPESGMHSKLVARYEYDVGLFFVSTKALREWCVPQQINYEDLVKQLTRNCEGKSVKKRMSKGTKLDIPPARVLSIRFAPEEDDEAPPATP